MVAWWFEARDSASVFIGICVAVAYSASIWAGARREGLAVPAAALGMVEALVDGGRNVVGVAATCACAGIIVSVITLTGLGLNISSLIVAFGGGNGSWGRRFR
jgi:TRAP-type uncharacterized transport system fused permease subunit